MSITIYQTSQNCTHVHPGERRGAHRKILTKILILFIYIPSSLSQSTSINITLFEKFLQENGFEEKYRVLEPSMPIQKQKDLMHDYNDDRFSILLLLRFSEF